MGLYRGTSLEINILNSPLIPRTRETCRINNPRIICHLPRIPNTVYKYHFGKLVHKLLRDTRCIFRLTREGGSVVSLLCLTLHFLLSNCDKKKKSYHRGVSSIYKCYYYYINIGLLILFISLININILKSLLIPRDL